MSQEYLKEPEEKVLLHKICYWFPYSFWLENRLFKNISTSLEMVFQFRIQTYFRNHRNIHLNSTVESVGYAQRKNLFI